MELHQIIIREMEQEQFIVLKKEVDGEGRLPILIGMLRRLPLIAGSRAFPPSGRLPMISWPM